MVRQDGRPCSDKWEAATLHLQLGLLLFPMFRCLIGPVVLVSLLKGMRELTAYMVVCVCDQSKLLLLRLLASSCIVPFAFAFTFRHAVFLAQIKQSEIRFFKKSSRHFKQHK